MRVIDYKSGAKTFSLSDICCGLNMQMLIYLFSICEAWPMPSRPACSQCPRAWRYTGRKNASGEEIQAQRLKRLRMNGILLEDRSVLSAMEPDLANVFYSGQNKKDGSF